MRRGHGEPAAFIAAFLGVTATRVRQLVSEHDIEPTGSDGKAKLYDIRDLLEHTDAKDRAARSN